MKLQEEGEVSVPATNTPSKTDGIEGPKMPIKSNVFKRVQAIKQKRDEKLAK